MNLFSVLILSDHVVSWSCKLWGSEPCAHGKEGSHQPYSTADFTWTLMAPASLAAENAGAWEDEDDDGDEGGRSEDTGQVSQVSVYTPSRLTGSTPVAEQ